jgi:DNA-binding MltR family transcriptional regulator
VTEKKKRHSDPADMQSEASGVSKSLTSESDRGLALIAAAYFDATLRRMLLAHFESTGQKSGKLIDPLFEGFGPLSSFSSKIGVCYAFNLIGYTLAKDLHLIRKIRNDFAHSLSEKDFEDPAINKLIDQLWQSVLLSTSSKHDEGDVKELALYTSKQRFSYILGCLTSLCMTHVVIADQEKMTHKNKVKFANSISRWGREKIKAASKKSARSKK